MGTYIEWVFDVTNVVAVFHRQHCYCLPSLDFRFREHEASPKIFDEKEKYLKVFLQGRKYPLTQSLDGRKTFRQSGDEIQ